MHPVVILCGGRGTRLQEHTREIPKPLVEIGGRPIVWHVVQIYAAHGFQEFVLATGYRHEMIEEFTAAESWPPGVTVECVDTGEETLTGGRIHRLRDRLDGGRFCATYADGVADIDLGHQLSHHGSHGGEGHHDRRSPGAPVRHNPTCGWGQGVGLSGEAAL